MKKSLLVSLTVVSIISADPLITYIGTKAKGMGGAFTAVANNNSAMYFNPAGLSNFEKMDAFTMTFEGGIGAKIDQKANSFDEYYSSAPAYFIGLASITQEGGMGLAFYSLYNLELRSPSGKYLKENIKVMSLSKAYTLTDGLYPYGGMVSVGATIAYASSFSETDPTILNVSGYFVDIGTKIRLLNHRAFKFDVAANYRSPADLEGKADGIQNYKGVGVPQEIAYGLAFGYGSTYGLLTLAFDHKETGYKDATKNNDFALRLRNTITENIGIDFSTNTFQLRAGTYQTKYENSTSRKIEGYTIGGGYILGAVKKRVAFQQNIEFSYDSRTYISGTNETTEPFVSVSYNIAL